MDKYEIAYDICYSQDSLFATNKNEIYVVYYDNPIIYIPFIKNGYRIIYKRNWVDNIKLPVFILEKK